MDERNNFPWNNGLTPEQQREKDAILATMEKIGKNIREASTGVVIVSAMGMLMAAIIFFSSGFSLGTLSYHPLDGIVQVLYSLIFLVLAIGIFRRSRVCALIALIFYAGDTIALIFMAGLIGINWFVRAAFLFAFWLGVHHCFKFHAFAKQHITSNDTDILAFIQTRPKMSTRRRVVYISVAVIGVLIMIFGIANFMG